MTHLRKECTGRFFYTNQKFYISAFSPRASPLYALLIPFVWVTLKISNVVGLIGLASSNPVDVPLWAEFYSRPLNRLLVLRPGFSSCDQVGSFREKHGVK